jgi:hypothetical protein
MNGDETYGALGLKRAEPFHDAAGWKAKSSVPRYLDRHEVTVARPRSGIGGDGELTAKLFFVDRNQPAAAADKATENAERAMLCAINQFYDATTCLLVGAAFDADEGAIAHSGSFIRAGTARRRNMDDWRRAVEVFVPLGWTRNKLAIAVTAGYVGEHHGRQAAGVMQPLAAAINAAFIGKFAQHAFERGAIRILGAEGARQLANADLAATLADEGEQFVA